jgi:hypothetical protein
MASENDFFVFRRCKSLNANTILWMQHCITELEVRLEHIHKEIGVSKAADILKISSFNWDQQCRPEQTLIIGELSGLLLRYSEFVARNVITWTHLH